MSDAFDSENPSTPDYTSASSTSYSISSTSFVSLSSDEEVRAFAETRTKSVHDVMSRSNPAVIPISSDEGSSRGDPSSLVNTGHAPTVSMSDLSPSYRQTLRELLLACLARTVRVNPPPSAPSGLDVQPLSEWAWLYDFTDLDEASESFESLHISLLETTPTRTNE
ncbi:uncharacterized protein [Spinacia oleracea]|uniref:Uncharacterized protein n=1 Tax=Spinacia oleracea TaxID=3562 RepID=A0ABM3R2R5_SPIOL|nr:uncharacterized protein LOC130464376 [Spinacia oleracea]